MHIVALNPASDLKGLTVSYVEGVKCGASWEARADNGSSGNDMDIRVTRQFKYMIEDSCRDTR